MENLKIMEETEIVDIRRVGFEKDDYSIHFKTMNKTCRAPNWECRGCRRVLLAVALVKLQQFDKQ